MSDSLSGFKSRLLKNESKGQTEIEESMLNFKQGEIWVVPDHGITLEINQTHGQIPGKI